MSSTTTTTAGGLPARFAEFEPFAGWILETQPERYAKRLASSMDEMQAFYDTVFPRLREVMEFCDQFPIDDLSEEARRLMRLTFSLVEVSFCVEAWRQPRVPDSGAAEIHCTVEPVV